MSDWDDDWLMTSLNSDPFEMGDDSSDTDFEGKLCGFVEKQVGIARWAPINTAKVKNIGSAGISQ